MYPTFTTIEAENEITILSVSTLNQLARQTLETTLGKVWIEGEISNLSAPRSGHLYFSLKDENAQVSCALFRGYRQGCPSDFQDGMQVVARAQVSLYEQRGNYQLIVEYMEEVAAGQLQRAFEALKKKLHQEGLFDERHKKPLPASPKQIGIITSASGAALHDILTVLKKRCPFIPVVIYPSMVQGDTAAEQLIKAIETANARAECDVLILARGGGSLEDLWCFNDEALARAIFKSEIPIVSGVGHEVDFTIADFVADQRAPTPSAAASAVSPDKMAEKQQLQNLQHRFVQHMRNALNHWQLHINQAKKRLRDPLREVQNKAQQLDGLERRLHYAIKQYLQRQQQQLGTLSRALKTISPLSTLERGYAIITHQKTGDVIDQTNQVTPKDIIVARLHQGSLECEVKVIKE